ncbi:unnamed protein product [Rhizoctonia solani]|uniref:Uncharacterized protein n=1 Tax=Rhizoctonia solani TaxID=456999 RepID=A0A8H2W662_9AGAM|nr:unnamed protein product [Rhizoctonia solani]
MSIEQGKYFIKSLGSESLWAGVGPVPPVYPPYPSPLRGVVDQIRDPITVTPVGGDNYTLKIGRTAIGYNEEGIVRLVPYGDQDVKWAIDRGNGEGQFRIKIPNSDKYWTHSGEAFEPIRLEGANGKKTQLWKFESVN